MAVSAPTNTEGETLPRWNLADLYRDPEDPTIAADLALADTEAEAFQASYQGRITALSGEALGAAVEIYERIEERLNRVGAYASLLYSCALGDPVIGRFYQTVRERLTAISTRLVFFTLEINRLDEAALQRCLEAPALARYAPWLRDVRGFRPYQLADALEELLHEKHVVGAAAWMRLYDETFAKLRIGLDGRDLTLNEALDLFYRPEGERRAAAAAAVATALEGVAGTVGLITNTLAKDKEIEDRWRGFAQPISSRNLSNAVEDEVVAALMTAVKGSYERLSHRYFRLKARLLGVDRLEYWDRLAPLPEAEERPIAWREASRLVLDAYRDFSPNLATIGRRFFEEGWIDAAPDPAKSPGAFAHPTVPGAHPYILLNYMGRPRDVMTIAHELGHGIHQVLSGHNGMLMANAPLTLAETASVFGEMLAFRRLLAMTTDPVSRRSLVASKIESMLGTVVRQVAFAEFETLVHMERRSGELTPQRIGDIWRQTQGDSLGPAVNLGPGYEVYWTYVPHFIHSPFYVYAYAFGDCLVNSLYAVYQQAEDGFAGRYLDMLRAGGTRRHRELLAPFKLDASDPGFWDKGLDVVAALIDTLETLV